MMTMAPVQEMEMVMEMAMVMMEMTKEAITARTSQRNKVMFPL